MFALDSEEGRDHPPEAINDGTSLVGRTFELRQNGRHVRIESGRRHGRFLDRVAALRPPLVYPRKQ